MASKKPKVQILLEEEYYKLFKKICEKNERSESKMGEIIIKKYIDEQIKEKEI